MVTSNGHIGIHEGADGRTDVYDVMAIKPSFVTSMGYHIFLTMVLRTHADLRYESIANIVTSSFRHHFSLLRFYEIIYESIVNIVTSAFRHHFSLLRFYEANENIVTSAFRRFSLKVLRTYL